MTKKIFNIPSILIVRLKLKQHFLCTVCYNTTLHGIQRSVEPSFSVHVLSIFSLAVGVDCTHIIVINLFILRRIKAGESHNLHHIYFILQIIVCEYKI